MIVRKFILLIFTTVLLTGSANCQDFGECIFGEWEPRDFYNPFSQIIPENLLKYTISIDDEAKIYTEKYRDGVKKYDYIIKDGKIVINMNSMRDQFGNRAPAVVGAMFPVKIIDVIDANLNYMLIQEAFYKTSFLETKSYDGASNTGVVSGSIKLLNRIGHSNCSKIDNQFKVGNIINSEWIKLSSDSEGGAKSIYFNEDGSLIVANDNLKSKVSNYEYAYEDHKLIVKSRSYVNYFDVYALRNNEIGLQLSKVTSRISANIKIEVDLNSTEYLASQIFGDYPGQMFILAKHDATTSRIKLSKDTEFNTHSEYGCRPNIYFNSATGKVDVTLKKDSQWRPSVFAFQMDGETVTLSYNSSAFEGKLVKATYSFKNINNKLIELKIQEATLGGEKLKRVVNYSSAYYQGEKSGSKLNLPFCSAESIILSQANVSVLSDYDKEVARNFIENLDVKSVTTKSYKFITIGGGWKVISREPCSSKSGVYNFEMERTVLVNTIPQPRLSENNRNTNLVIKLISECGNKKYIISGKKYGKDGGAIEDIVVDDPNFLMDAIEKIME